MFCHNKQTLCQQLSSWHSKQNRSNQRGFRLVRTLLIWDHYHASERYKSYWQPSFRPWRFRPFHVLRHELEVHRGLSIQHNDSSVELRLPLRDMWGRRSVGLHWLLAAHPRNPSLVLNVLLGQAWAVQERVRLQLHVEWVSEQSVH
jgi:hypothetical protein